MQDRGQSMPVHKGMVRTTPCYIPFVQMQIEWDGELLRAAEVIVSKRAGAKDRSDRGMKP